MKFKLEKGQATRKLFEIIPVENVVAYLLIYYEMAATEIKKYSDITPEAEIEIIRQSLKKLMRKQYLSESDMKTVIGDLLKKMADKDITREAIASKAFIKEGSPENRPLNFLIYALIHDCNQYRNKPYFKVVAGFLNEQNLSKLDYDDLGKRYRKLNKTPAIKDYLINYLIASDELQNVIKSIGSSTESTIKKGFLSECFLEITSNLSSKKHP